MNGELFDQLHPRIMGKLYLELSIFNGRNFDATQTGQKTSVDRDHPAMFRLSTDDFFAQLPSDVRYDVVFIDACHGYGHVLRDYNNSVIHLAPGGIIFMHDMVPPSRDFTAQHRCGDAFKFTHWMVTHTHEDHPFFVQDSDYGLTFFLNPRLVSPPVEQASVTYEQFIEVMSLVRRYNRAEMQEMLKSL